MPDDRLIHPPSMTDGRPSSPAPATEAQPAPFADDAYLASYESPEPGIDIRRYLLAVLRYKWLLVIAVVNRLVLSTSLLSNPKVRQRLRLTIGAELLLFAAIVSVTGWLTTYASPHDADHESKNEEIAAAYMYLAANPPRR